MEQRGPGGRQLPRVVVDGREKAVAAPCRPIVSELSAGKAEAALKAAVL